VKDQEPERPAIPHRSGASQHVGAALSSVRQHVPCEQSQIIDIQESQEAVLTSAAGSSLSTADANAFLANIRVRKRGVSLLTCDGTVKDQEPERPATQQSSCASEYVSATHASVREHVSCEQSNVMDIQESQGAVLSSAAGSSLSTAPANALPENIRVKKVSLLTYDGTMKYEEPGRPATQDSSGASEYASATHAPVQDQVSCEQSNEIDIQVSQEAVLISAVRSSLNTDDTNALPENIRVRKERISLLTCDGTLQDQELERPATLDTSGTSEYVSATHASVREHVSCEQSNEIDIQVSQEAVLISAVRSSLNTDDANAVPENVHERKQPVYSPATEETKTRKLSRFLLSRAVITRNLSTR